MARKYAFNYSVTPSDEKVGMGMGSSITFRYENGEWATDEDLHRRAQDVANYLFFDLRAARDREIELDRAAAKPFWQRWLG